MQVIVVVSEDQGEDQVRTPKKHYYKNVIGSVKSRLDRVAVKTVINRGIDALNKYRGERSRKRSLATKKSIAF